MILYICGVHLWGGPSAFVSHWQHWTVKRSLCALTVVTGGPSTFDVCIFIYALVFPYIFFYLPVSLIDNIEWWRDHSVLWQWWLGGPSAFESQWQHWTVVKRSLCALTVVNWGGPSAFGVCIFIYALVFPYIFFYLPVSLNDNIEQWRDHSVPLTVVTGGVHLPLSLNDNIEQWRDHSVLW